MKPSWKLSLVAIMAGALALVLILGASMGTAAAPDPALSDDLLAMGDAGNSRVRIIDVDAQAVVNDITGPSVMSNHGVLWEGDKIWTANAGQTSPGTMKVVQLDTTLMGESAAFSAYVSGAGGLCGIEFAQDNPAAYDLWVASMGATGGNNGVFEVDKTTGFTGSYVDTGSGADNRATCGISWDATGSIAVATLMHAKKTTEISWGTGLTGRAAGDASVPSDLHSAIIHINDNAKSTGYGYVSAGAGSGVGSALDVIDLATMDVVGSLPLGGYNPHSVVTAHSDGFAYSHSRGVSGGSAASILVYDIGGGSAGGSAIAPVLIGSFADGGGAGSCGVDVTAKSDFCAQPALSLDMGSAYWASPADYAARKLSVDFTINNGSGNNIAAHNLTLVSTTNTGGVTCQTNDLGGSVAAGGSTSFTAKYIVPMGVMGFNTTLGVSAEDLCGNVYTYGG